MVRGEAVLTRDGIEGGAIYALSAALRDAIAAAGQAMLRVALRPDLDANNLTARLSAARGKQSFSTFLRKAAGLSPAAIGLLQEIAVASGVSLSAMPPEALAARINNVEIVLSGTSALEKSISTAGGIAFDELDADYMNQVLVQNAILGPWIHVGSNMQLLEAAKIGDALAARAKVTANYEKKGHRFVELDAVVVANGNTPVARCQHIAIYQPREQAAA